MIVHIEHRNPPFLLLGQVVGVVLGCSCEQAIPAHRWQANARADLLHHVLQASAITPPASTRHQHPPYLHQGLTLDALGADRAAAAHLWS